MRSVRSYQKSIVGLIGCLALACAYLSGCGDQPLGEITQTVGPGTSSVPNAPNATTGTPRDYLFCFWNVENFFDDKDDNRTGPGDKEFDELYSHNAELLRLKLSKMTEALLSMNGGIGPDIFAMVEVESIRAAELLQHALNAKIADPRLHYQAPLMKEVTVGRHIAPAILTRLPVVRDRTRGHGSRFRIVEGHIVVDGHELIVMGSHWTSRLKEANVKGRTEYADKLYGASNAIYHANPKADFLICGDFNDSPDDVSVTQHLRATADARAVRAGGQSLQLLNLFADKNPAGGFGTHYHSKWYIFDQIVVSPGMLDSAGWSCDPATTQTIALAKPSDKNRRPWKFGNEKETGPRGYSDHFPVTVRLQVGRL